MTDRLIFEESELILTWNSWVNVCWLHIFWTDKRFHPKLSTLLYHGRHADIWRVWTAKWLGILECLSVHLPSSELLNLSWPTLFVLFCLFVCFDKIYCGTVLSLCMASSDDPLNEWVFDGYFSAELENLLWSTWYAGFLGFLLFCSMDILSTVLFLRSASSHNLYVDTKSASCHSMFPVLQAFSSYFYLMEFLNLTSTDIIRYTDFTNATRSLCAMNWTQVSSVLWLADSHWRCKVLFCDWLNATDVERCCSVTGWLPLTL